MSKDKLVETQERLSLAAQRLAILVDERKKMDDRWKFANDEFYASMLAYNAIMNDISAKL